MYSRFIQVALALVLSLGFASGQELKLELTEETVPEEIAQETRALLCQTPFTILADGQASARFWLREDPQMSPTPSAELGVTFGQLRSGSLLGIVQLLQPWSDYKKNSIQPGTYTLRYGVMPADGNHMGVSPYRDYLLLIPAAGDTDPNEAYSYVELLTGSVQASGISHPAVLALFPIWEDVSGPTLTKNEMDQWTLAIKLGEQVVGLVVSGHGEI